LALAVNFAIGCRSAQIGRIVARLSATVAIVGAENRPCACVGLRHGRADTVFTGKKRRREKYGSKYAGGDIGTGFLRFSILSVGLIPAPWSACSPLKSEHGNRG
jgi:hypothetical protein